MIEFILSSLSGGGVGGILRLIGEGVTMWAKKQEVAHERQRDDDEHQREMERLKFEMDNAEKIRADRLEAAEEADRIAAGAQMAESDAAAEKASLNFGNPALWPSGALGATDWSGAFNRFLLAIVNFVNGMVRGSVTYYYLGGYGAIKFIMFESVVEMGLRGQEKVDALLMVVTPFDTTLLGTIVGFWFMDRSLRKRIKEQGGAGR